MDHAGPTGLVVMGRAVAQLKSCVGDSGTGDMASVAFASSLEVYSVPNRTNMIPKSTTAAPK